MARNFKKNDKQSREAKAPSLIAYHVEDKGQDKSGPASAQPGITKTARGSRFSSISFR
ncbi:hypothetical protein ABIB94_008165 [Bradyrhizobium sp. JR7.2]|uniref:hypothetical protein n=1 Tax=Bradyrhizobium TaxID=374 RepID=UPI0007C18B07|nr:hypothetical protein [Bradyrhizobium japonicum]CUT16790.1 hypothetical protein CDS [Bradyrhizobium sp.]MCP1768297.1 hypothetical protein [Bradyrhizobium japonicum]MCP1794458.1 hypothetical protein [Bradyrhizobium japonicum]MCP1811275.1 hypothetical protein [Bradyrhizobium japonicum]MCP1821360.1 hypothetical protein [Bradyrhizobium japonicum]